MISDEERTRELAEWLHFNLTAVVGLAWQQGDCCDKCIKTVKNELLPILAQVRLEEAKWWNSNFFKGAIGLHWWDQRKERIAALEASVKGAVHDK